MVFAGVLRKGYSEFTVYMKKSETEKGWESSIEAWKSPPEGRSLSEYEAQLNFKASELKGNKILDLGSGIKDMFAQEVQSLGIGAEVISLSPDYSNPHYARTVRKAFPEGKQVVGLGQKLPFGGQSFDRIFALHVYEHITSKEIFLGILMEMVRTLRPGGIAKFGPMEDIPHGLGPPDFGALSPYEIARADESLREELAKNHTSLIKEEMPESVMPLIKVKDSYGESYDVPRYNLVLVKGNEPD